MRFLASCIAVLLAASFLAVGCAKKNSAAPSAGEVIPIGQITANPGKFVGEVRMGGKAGRVDSEKGVMELTDEGGCCKIPLALPFTEEQRRQYGDSPLYSGKWPQPGQKVEVEGRISKVEGGYRFDIDKIFSGAELLISKN